MKILFILPFIALSSFASTNQDLQKNTEYQWKEIKRKNEVKYLSVTGQVIAQEGALHYQSARVNGRVLSLMSEEGSFIKKGEPLFKITGPECVSMREERRIAEKANLLDLISSIEQRQKELNLLVTERDCLLISDAEGVLVKRTSGTGNSFSYGDTLAQVLEESNFKIEIEIPEKSSSMVSKGSVVSFTIPSLNGFKGSSKIQQTFPIVEEGTRIMKARLNKIPLPKGTKLNSMVFAEIYLDTGKTCFAVPTTAITFQDNGAWIMKKDNDLHPLSVTVLSVKNNETLILPVQEAQIKEGDLIATYNVPFLYQQIKKNNHKSASK